MRVNPLLHNKDFNESESSVKLVFVLVILLHHIFSNYFERVDTNKLGPKKLKRWHDKQLELNVLDLAVLKGELDNELGG